MKFIKKIAKKFLLHVRHQKFKKRMLKQKDVTILSNCCIGGTMYNDLGLKFLSPTINLFFGHHGFIDLVNNLSEYKDAELCQTDKYDLNENGVMAPVGILKKRGLPDIEIHFLHYDSFDIAKKKWFERFDRINFSKIYLVIEAKDDHEHELLEEYAKLNYPKIIFTNIASTLPCVMNMKFYNSNKNNSVTNFIGFFGKRGYDEFDFVENIFNSDYQSDKKF